MDAGNGQGKEGASVEPQPAPSARGVSPTSPLAHPTSLDPRVRQLAQEGLQQGSLAPSPAPLLPVLT